MTLLKSVIIKVVTIITVIINLGDFILAGTISKAASSSRLRSGYKFGSFKGIVTPGSGANRNRISSDPKNDRIKFGTLETSAVGVGTISWFVNGDGANPDLDEVMRVAREEKADIFDTAERYGSSSKEAFGGDWGSGERFLGEYVSQFDSDGNANGGSKGGDLKIATKFTPTPFRRDANSVMKACEAAKKRLNVDSIDLYQIHMPDIVQPLKIFGIKDEKDEKYWDGLIECYRRGLVKNVGVSNYGPTMLMRASEYMARRGVPLVSNQINYSLLYRKNGAQETVDLGRAMGVQTIGYYPLAMGLLSGKHSKAFNNRQSSEKEKSSAAGRETSSSSGGGEVVDTYAVSGKSPLELRELRGKKYEPVLPLLKVMQEIAERRKKSIPQIALNWVMCKGVLPIAGVRNAAQLKDNLGARGWRLSKEEVALLEYTADSLGFSFEGAGFKRSSEKFVGYGMEKWSLI